MNGSRDQVMLGLALQNGLINREQALLVKERHEQFFQANRPVSVSAILRALKMVTDQELERLEKAVDESGLIPAAGQPNLPVRPPTAPNANAVRRAGGGAPAAHAAPVARGGKATPAAGVPAAAAAPRRSTDPNPAAPASPTTAQPASPGGAKMLGKYRILSQLGQGGMGAVYLAEDTHLNRKVALKVLPKELASNREFIKRFLAEARVTGKLSHPNIVVAYDIDSSQGLWFMAMEYLEGESIGARLKRSDPIPWRDALTMVKQICKGLAYAHKVGIVHRDIKPDNLFLDKSSGEAKILDMGLSKNLHASENSSLTQAGMILGTPNYLAPEQAENGINVDARADIYSLGTTLYHMLTGMPPFEGPTPLSIIQKHLFEPMPDVRKGRPECPSDVANLVWKMTAKKPADRFNDCTEMLAAIDDVMEGRGFQLADPMQGPGPRRTGSGGRNPAAGSGSRTAARNGTRGTRGVAPIERKSRNPQSRQNSTPVLFVVVGGLLVVAVGLLAWLALKNNTPPADTTAAVTPPPPKPPIEGSRLPNVQQPSGTPLAVAPAPDLSAIVAIASRGLNMSSEIDHELENAEKDRLAALPTTPAAGNPPPANLTAGAADASLTPKSGDEGIVHALTAEEKKKAATLLDAFRGNTLFRMNVPDFGADEIASANIAAEPCADLNKLKVMKIGPPPTQFSPKIYQGLYVELDPREKAVGTITKDSRIRFLLKVDCNDRLPVEYKFMYSTLPSGDTTCLGGIIASTAACEWELVDVELGVFDKRVMEKNWFGYATGVPEDYKNNRKITVSVSDIIIYNPKN